MKNNESSRRKFIGSIAAGALATGIAMIPESIQASAKNELSKISKEPYLDQALKQLGKKEHPVAFDVSQAISSGIIWANVYYKTNVQTGTPENKLGVLVVLRHSGIFFAMNDATIKKYNLGARTKFKDSQTKGPIEKNPMYDPPKGSFPLPGFTGIKGLQEKGAVFCVCDMAIHSSSRYLAKKMNLKAEDVYKDLVEGTLPGILSAPAGVWAGTFGRK